MKTIISVHFLGQFSIKNGKKSLNDQMIRSKKIMKLLAYLVLNSKRMISVEELGEFLWGDGGSDNPTGALKNLIYRLRNMLAELSEEELIQSNAGAYGWNPEVPIEIDMMEFEKYTRKARGQLGGAPEKLAAFEKAVALYQEPQNSRLLAEPWMAVRFTYYHSMYLSLIHELCELYNETGQFKKMQEVCEHALTCDELDEEIHCWLIRSWIRQNEMDHALRHYYAAVKILYEQLGVYRSPEMGELYKEIVSMQNTDTASMEDIYDDISEEDPNGVFLCEYGIFREVYRLEARKILRTQMAEYIVLLTICQKEEGAPIEVSSYYKKKALEKLQQTLISCLRIGDVVARYSDTQYIVMLPTCNFEAAEKVTNRIRSEFCKKMKNNKLEIKSELREISLYEDIPGQSGGGSRL